MHIIYTRALYIIIYKYLYDSLHEIRRLTISNWFTWSWELQSPKTCRQQLETQASWWVQKQKEAPVRALGTGRGSFLLLSPFVLFRSSMDWMRPTTLGRTICFTQLTGQMLISCSNTLADTLRIMWGQLSRRPEAPSSWQNYPLQYSITYPFNQIKRPSSVSIKVLKYRAIVINFKTLFFVDCDSVPPSKHPWLYDFKNKTLKLLVKMTR